MSQDRTTLTAGNSGWKLLKVVVNKIKKTHFENVSAVSGLHPFGPF